MHLNITFHCDYCGEILGLDRYEISPFSGKRCTARAWCPKCYEMLAAWVQKEEGQDADDEDEVE